ncbi:MAG TPA: hypothetical protein VHA05_02740 [Candidatus Saccharimonadales bacterium]|nr:hypothetical protein [Candidatus Saccharimonadales bacterium]
MIIVGLTGSIGSGKTTFADFLSAQADSSGHWESWQLVAEVAAGLRRNTVSHPSPDDPADINRWLEPLPEIVERVCRKKVSFDKLKVTEARLRKNPELYDKLLEYLGDMQAEPSLQGLEITETNKESLRSILQWLGGYLAKKCGGDIWYAEIIRRIRSKSDLELATIGGVRFPDDAKCVTGAGGVIVEIVRPGVKERDKNDLTERERKLIHRDCVVYNDGSLEDLAACAKSVVADLKNGVLAPEYHASN